MRHRSVSGIAFSLILAGTRSALADPQGLSTNVPVQIEDAFPAVEYGEGQLQYDGRYTRDPHDMMGSNEYTHGPTIKLGLLPHTQFDLNPGYTNGDGSGAGRGTTSIDSLVQLTGNSRLLPALALHAFYEIPYGSGHISAQYTLRGVATKYLGTGKSSPRLHLNLTWIHVTQPDRTTRRDQMEIAGGISFLLTGHTAMVLDVVHGAQAMAGRNQSFIDAGFLHDIDEDWSVGLGGGAGVAQNSPQLRMFVSVQRSFKLF